MCTREAGDGVHESLIIDAVTLGQLGRVDLQDLHARLSWVWEGGGIGFRGGLLQDTASMHTYTYYLHKSAAV